MFFLSRVCRAYFPARRIGRPPRTHWASCALWGGPQGQAGRLGFFQTPESLFLSWKDQECNITSIALELFLLGHFRCFKFQISLPGKEELKQPTARLLSCSRFRVSPASRGTASQKTELSSPRMGNMMLISFLAEKTKIPKTSLTFPMFLSGKVRTRYPDHLKILVLTAPLEMIPPL